MTKKQQSRQTQIVKNNEQKLEINNKHDQSFTLDEIYKIIDMFFKRKNIMYSHSYNAFDKLLDEDIPQYLTQKPHIFFEKITKDNIRNLCHSNTKVILSGFLDYQKDELEQEYRDSGFVVDKIFHKNSWITMVLKK